MQRQVFVNGEIREATDYAGKNVLRQCVCLKCIKVVDDYRNFMEDSANDFGKEAFNDTYLKC